MGQNEVDLKLRLVYFAGALAISQAKIVFQKNAIKTMILQRCHLFFSHHFSKL